MKVQINGVLYDAKETPIMVILNDSDKKNIENMLPNANKYICWPDGMSQEDMRKKLNQNKTKMSRLWEWIIFNIPLMWELDGYLTKRMLRRLKKKYNKNKQI